jgi:hypothetical protein
LGTLTDYLRPLSLEVYNNTLDTNSTIDTIFTTDATPLSPVFDENTYVYVDTLAYGTTEVPDVVVNTVSPTASVSIDTAATLNDTTRIIATAEDGVTKSSEYKIVYYVMLNNDATLDTLYTNDATAIVPSFDPNTYVYMDTVAYGSAVPVITALANDINANVSVTAAATLTDTTNIVVTAEDGVTSLTYKVAFFENPNPVSVNNLTVKPLLAYPNPAKDIIHINSNGMVNIYTISGIKVLTANVKNGQIDVSALVSGVYILEIGKSVSQIVVQ